LKSYDYIRKLKVRIIPLFSQARLYVANSSVTLEKVED